MSAKSLPAHIADAIIEHNQILIDACQHNIEQLMAMTAFAMSDQVRGQILYWKQCKAGLKWSNSVARQRREK